jgi:hypothetical protein
MVINENEQGGDRRGLRGEGLEGNWGRYIFYLFR